ncbi:hypothetical protein GCM10009774_22780 [Cellulomonas gelida]|uniref:Uncharacterized protein n=1 Tax=Cellulomonas gelida TaxID=1712 RepID=A0A4Y3KH69_9CELL|nr:hypothetical protein CGE01nite_09900 [Cellulomonas gelida]GGL31718.1 hypothetical protein GCM10009774_22780 [Cellulomonas gelida]
MHEQAHRGVLHQVLGCGGLAAHAERHAQQRTPMLTDELRHLVVRPPLARRNPDVRPPLTRRIPDELGTRARGRHPGLPRSYETAELAGVGCIATRVAPPGARRRVCAHT